MVGTYSTSKIDRESMYLCMRDFWLVQAPVRYGNNPGVGSSRGQRDNAHSLICTLEDRDWEPDWRIFRRLCPVAIGATYMIQAL